MSTPLLATKLYIPPVRPERVPRPRLLERLEAGLDRKLTLISAPAGFGKTTLISECAARCGHPVAWISLDKSDNEPVRFWDYVVAALQTIPQIKGTELGQPVLALFRSSQPPSMETLLSALINELVRQPLINRLVANPDVTRFLSLLFTSHVLACVSALGVGNLQHETVLAPQESRESIRDGWDAHGYAQRESG